MEGLESSGLVTIDDALKSLGGRGLYQKIVLVLVILIWGPHAIIPNSFAFLIVEPEFECFDPDQGEWFSCSESQACSENQEYRVINADPQRSFVFEFELYCSENVWIGVVVGAYYVGAALGLMIWPRLSDRVGRKGILKYLLPWVVVLTIVTAESPSKELMTLALFFQGFFLISISVLSFVLLTECMAIADRSFAASILNAVYAAFIALFAIIAWRIPHWRSLCWVILIFSLVACSTMTWLDESPRMGATNHNKKLQSVKTFEKISSYNKGTKTLPFLINFGSPRNCLTPQEHREVSYWFLLSEPSIRPLLLPCLYLWFGISLGYFGLMYAVPILNVNAYLSVALMSSIEVIFVPFTSMIVESHGRKSLLLSSGIVGGLSLVIFPFVANEVLLYVLLLISRLGMAFAFNLAYIITPELFATSVRSNVVGMCSWFARLSVFLAPLITHSLRLPAETLMIAFGVTVISVGLTSFFIPETLGKPLEDKLVKFVDTVK